MNTAVLIVDLCDSGSEREAIRQSLELFGYTVMVKPVGRPKDLIDILQGNLVIDADYVIISCHGEGGKIIMPTLAEDVYFPEEPRGNFGPKEVEQYCQIKGKTIISTGCTVGCDEMADVFAKNNIYIAPTDYIDGKAAIMFMTRLFYELGKSKKVTDAFETARKTDDETGLFGIKCP